MEEWDNQIDRLDEYMRHLHYRLSVETNPSVLIEPTDYVVKHLEILTSNMNAYNSIDMCDLKERTRCLLYSVKAFRMQIDYKIVQCNRWNPVIMEMGEIAEELEMTRIQYAKKNLNWMFTGKRWQYAILGISVIVGVACFA